MHFTKSFKLKALFVSGLLMFCITAIAQVPVPFGIRYQNTIKGDMTMIANNIVNRQSNGNPTSSPYSGTSANDDLTMRYIDIDGDASTFSSSSATLNIPDVACSDIVYAGLYWSATYRYNGSNSGSGRATNIHQVKLKLPGAAAYTDINGSVIFDGFFNNTFDDNSPYACYANVTTLLQGLANPNGVYTVANVRATQADLSGGVSGGWTLFIVYENPEMPGRYITSYDGFAAVNQGVGSVDVNYTGFTTVPAPLPVYAKLATAALEGDRQITGDQLRFKAASLPGFTQLGNGLNPTNNFFNSTITYIDGANNPANFTTRAPNSSNTLGWDADIININQGLIPNGETGATLRMMSTQDQYYMFFNALNVDIIEPEVSLIKTVQDIAGNDITGQDVNLGNVLDYVISFQNIGNDHAQNVTIRDVLPENTNFNSIDLSGAPGVTYTYNASLGEITFTVPNNLVEMNDPAYTIRIRIQVVNSCSELTDACSNVIRNQAFATYRGIQNPNLVTDDPSVAGVDACGLGSEGPSNFLVDIDNCTFTRDEVLCGASVTLTAGDGYASYAWYRENGATDIFMGSTQSISVNMPGQYYVVNTPNPPCVGLTEYINVTLFGAGTPNPVAPFADEIAICPNDGDELPYIFLCGIDDSQLIQTNIVNAQSIIWEKLNDGSCPPQTINGCANENMACTWSSVGTGANFNVTQAGEYRLTINFQNGCFSRYYFNVYANLLDPQFTFQNIQCTVPGNITVTNVPAGYEYQLVNQATNTVLVPYQNSPSFTIATSGAYMVQLRQIGVTDGCVFELPNIGIMNMNMNVNFITQNAGCSGLGSITVQALNANPQYYYSISGPSTEMHGPLTDNSHTFPNLNPGTYTITVTNDNGCNVTDTVTIIDTNTLVLNAVISQHITCSEGNIQMNSSGGQNPHIYAIWSYNGVLQNPGPGDYQSSVIFDVPLGQQGTYVFIVKDNTGCTRLSNEVTINLEPDVQYNTAHQNVTCNGGTNGSITYTITSGNGFSISYALENSSGTVIATNSTGIFTGLAAGDYTIVLTQSKGNKSCSFETDFTITQPPALVAGAPSITQALSCTATATVTLNPASVSGGVAPYTYSINGTTFGASSTFAGLTAGTYTITVRDANNCILTTAPVTINPLPAITNITFAATQVTCPTLTSNVTLTVAGGQAPFTYSITSPAGSAVNNGNSNVFAGLAPGTYTFQVTDANQCTFNRNYTISPITQINATGLAINNVSCLGYADGSLNYTVTGFSTNYNYTVVNGGGTTVDSGNNSTLGTINLSSLEAETYTVTVTDNVTNCTATAIVTIQAPPAALTVPSMVVNRITCLTSGSVSIAATGGWGGYQYVVEMPDGTSAGPQTSGVFNNLTIPGTYNVFVIDANNCVVADSFNLTLPTNPVATISAASDICYNSDGAAITIDVTGGLAPYQYSLNGAPAQATSTFSGLTPGSYTVTVIDANGCTDTATQTIHPQLSSAATLTKNLDCTASPNAVINITVNGGLAGYTYQVSANGGAYGASTAVAGTSVNYSVAAAGTYQFRITDATGCSVETGTITVAPLTQPAITSVTQTQNILCFGENTGAISVVINNTVGVGPFTVNVVNTTTGVNYGTQTSGLAAGNYQITITDSNSCTSVVQNIILTQPNALAYNVGTVDITCGAGGTTLGEISVNNVTGGTAGYTYYVTSNFGFNESYVAATGANHAFTILNYGIYQVEVVDANGCSLVTQNVVIASPPNDLTIDVSAITSDCLNGGTAEVTVSAAVLSGSYEFGILTTYVPPYLNPADYQSADAGTPETSTFTGLIPGVTYTFVVHDLVTNCYYFKEAEAPINTPSGLTATIDQVNNVTCTGAADGNVDFTFTGYNAGATAVNYEVYQALSNAPTGITGSSPVAGTPVTANLGPLAPGVYFILFTEVGGAVAGCTNASAEFTILESTNVLAVNATVTKNDNCNTNAGIITAVGQFGTAPYQYQAVAAGSAPVSGNWSAANVFNLEGGNYDIYITDAYGCVRFDNITLPTDLAPAITGTVTAQCFTDEGDFSITVNRTQDGIGPYTYSLNGGAFVPNALATFTYDDLTSGSYTIEIRDANGCGNTVTIDVLAPVNATPVVAVQPSCANNDGQIQVTAVGGSGNYQYELQDTNAITIIAPQASSTFTGLSAGDYLIVLHDLDTGCLSYAVATLEVPTPVTFTATGTNVSCNGGTDASINITLPASNDNPPYTFTIDNGIDPAITQGTGVFTNLGAGTYTVTVTSGKNCTLTDTVTITEPSLLTIAAAATPFACDAYNNVNTSTVTITAAGGTAPFTFSIDGVNYFTANTFSLPDTGTVQNITAFVKDNNNCIASIPFTIDPIPVITAAAAAQVTAITCTNDETVQVTVTGGSGDYTFEVLPQGSQAAVTPGIGVSTASFDITAPGSYTFQVTDNVTGCYELTAAYDIAPFDTIEVNATAATAVTCFGAANGTLTIDVTGYSGAYDYEVTDGTTTIATGSGNTTTNPFTITGVTAGNFFVRVTATGTPFCTDDTNNITIPSPANALTLNATIAAQVTCTNNMGEIVAIANGGWGTYEYELVNTTTSATIQAYSANNIFSALTAGDYTVSVRDAGNCIITQNLTLVLPSPVAASITTVGAILDCNGDTNASVSATGVTGGQGTYQYVLNIYDPTGTTIVVSSAPQTSATFNNLGAGIYSITVVDGWSCDITTNTATITQPTPVQGFLSVTTGLTCTAQAELTVTATGGTAPYQYSADNITFSSTNVFNVGPGSYQYYVRDANGCTAILTNQVTVPTLESLELNLNLSNSHIYCSGEATASITSNASGGLGNYMYELRDASNTVIAGPQPNGTFTNLAAGTYYMHVISGDCETTSTPIVITEPTPLAVTSVENDILCFGDANGSIELYATGGTGTYQYAISPNLDQFVTTNVFTGLAPGLYDVIVQDQNGCFEVLQFQIDEPAPLIATFGTIQDEVCFGENDGSITVEMTGGTGQYLVSLDGVTYTNVIGSTHTFSNLTSDMFFMIHIMDTNGCNINPPLEYYMMPAVEIIPTITVTPTCTANVPGNTVTVNVNAEVVADVQYSLDGVTYQASNTFTNLAPGNYTAYVQHTNTCVRTVDFIIDTLVPVAATATVDSDVLCFGGNTGAITVNGTGGTGALEYAISPAFAYGATNTFTNLTADNYTIRVRDSIGCEFELTGVVVTQPAAALSATLATTDEICLNAADGTVTITVSGGTAPYATSLDGVTFNAGQMTYTGLAVGSHTVYVTDANNCAITPLNFSVNPGVDIQAGVTVTDNCTANVPGNIVTVAVNAAVAANVQYSVDGVTYQASNTFTNLAPGTYTAYVEHANGCIDTEGFVIDNLVPVVANATVTTDVLCFGAATGVITVTATGGTGALEYAISPAFAYGTSNVFSGLAAGNYTVMVRDAIGCEVSVTGVMVTQPAAALSATLATTDEICLNAADGTVTITVSGGTAPYATSLDGVTFNAGQMTYTGLAVGSHTVYVTDANNCAITPLNFSVNPGVDIQAGVTVTDNCTANVPGNIVTVAVNAAVAANVQYSVDGVTYQASNTFTNLAPGTYTAYVQHTNGCIDTEGFVIDNLVPVVANATVTTDVLCFGAATGVITVTATGGTGALQYAISPAFAYGTSNVFSGLAAGNYTIMVRDAIGCEVTVTGVTVTQPAAALSATLATTDEICLNAADGTVTITVSGGTAPYATSLDGVTFNAGQMTYTGLAVGSHTVYVTDANNCAITPLNFSVNPGVDIQAGVTVTDNCTANVPGNIVTVAVNAAVAANVQYSVDGVTYQASNTFTNLATGTYTVYVQHTNGCIDTEGFVINNLVPVAANATVTTDVLCFGAATGVITVTATGGTGTLQYAISPAFAYGTSNVFSGLAAGNYTVMVRDAIGCEVSVTGVMVTQPAAALSATLATTDEICLNAADGTVTITVSGGTAPYATSLDGVTFNAGQMTYTGLAVGSHTVYVTDANNCAITPLNFSVNPGVDIQAGVTVTDNCTANVPGNIVTVAVNAAVAANVQYSVDGVTYQASNTFTNIAPGTYTAYVQHTNGCIDTEGFVIDNLVPVAANAAVTTDVLCFGAATGVITVTATGGTGTLQYAISPAFAYGTSNVFSGLAAGNYTIMVRDAIGCEVSVTGVTVTQPAAALSATLATTDEICLNAADGTVTITVSGGTAPYATSLDGVTFNAGQMTYTGLAVGSHTVYVTDANNCAITPLNFSVNPGVDIQAGVTVTDNCTANVPGNIVTVAVNAAVAANVQYSVDGVTYQASNTFTNLAPGTYTAYVQHANGCIDTEGFVIDNLVPVVANATVTTDVLCFGAATSVITVTATGGTGALQYAISPAFAYGTSNVFSGLAAGNYTIMVRDAIGCEVSVTGVTVTQPAAALSATLATTDEICLNAADGTVTITVSGGTAPYATSLDGVTFNAGQMTYTGLAVGSHTVYVTDANNCAITPLNFSVNPGVDIQAGVTVTDNCTANVPGNIVTVAVNAAVAANVQYSVDGVTYQASNTFTNLAPGTYTAYVQHTNGCIDTEGFVIDNLVPVAANATVTTDVLCFGAATGVITVTATGGTGTLQYAISPAFAYGTSNVFSGLAAGNYTVMVRDAIGCEVSVTGVTVTQPAAALSATLATTDEGCLGANDGTVTITATGGVAPYSTSLDGVTFTQDLFTYANLTVGSHTVYVTDANGCAITPIIFNILPGVNFLATATVTPNCTSNVPGNIVTVTVGAAFAADVQYSLDGVTYGTSNTWTNLAPGNYTAYVLHTNGCIQTDDFAIDNLVPVTANAVVTSNALCFGEATGVITVNATGGTGTIEYAISPAFAYGTSNVFSGLTAGTYTVMVRDAIGCEVTVTGVTVTEPAAVLSASVMTIDETCIDANDGSVKVIVSGGTAPYSTSLDGVTFNTGVFDYNNLADGNYTVYVTDANGCAVTPINFTILPGVDIQATVDVTGTCTANTPGNTVTVSVNAAVAADVQYSINGVTYQPSNTFTNLVPGNYTAYVQHTNGCIDTATFTINNLVPVTANAVVTSNALCFGEATGVITVNATGGTGTIEYAISPAFAYGTSNVFSGLTAGTYTVMVRDAIGCEVTVTGVTVTEPAASLTASVMTVDETCIDANDGSVKVIVSGGTAPYSTSLDGVTFNAGVFDYNNLADGNYTVYVTDANGCTVTPINFTILPGVDIQATVDVAGTCTGNVPGNTVTVSVNAAVAADVQYSINGVTYQPSNTFTNLVPGNYTAYVQHTNGCIDTATFTINNLIPVTANAVVTSNALCFGEATGVITVNATGGTGTIEYAISPAFAYGTSNVFSGLTAGTYTVMVRDAIGCEVTVTGVTVTEPAASLTASVMTIDETCIDANDGSVKVIVSGGTAPYSTSLDGVTFNAGVFDYNNLADGNYTVYVTDANGCTVTPINFTILPGVDIQATVDVTGTCTGNVPGNTVTVSVNAAVAADVQYSINGVTYQASNTFTNLVPGNYTAYVQHTNGCIDTATFTINNLIPVTANATVTSNVLCFGEATGVITVNATGGTGTIEYAISPAFAYGTSNVFSGLTAGTYTVMVRDAIGCEVTVTGVTMTEPAAVLSASVMTIDETCIDANDGSVKVIVSGGTAPYSTSLDGVTFNTGVFDYNNLADGNYTVYVTDANGCTVTPVDFVINPGVEIIPTADVVNNCTSNVVGNIVTVNVNAAVAADVQYSVDGVIYQASNTFNNLAPGNYTAYVQHANGCVATATFDIDNLVPVTANATVTSNVLCFGEASGVITVNATGGTGTIEYAISPAFAYGTNNVFANLPAGAYTVRVRDAIGCELEFSNVIITEPAAALTATVATTDEICINESNGTVTVTINGGTAPYATSLNGVTFNNGQLTYTGLADGNYTMYVTDANNCAITPINFTIAPGVDVQATVDVTDNCTANVVGNVVMVNVNAAVATDVQYSVDGVIYQASNTFTNLAPGAYTAYVQHANGCVATATFDIDNLVPVTANATVTSNVLCFGEASGVITVNATGGTGTIEYAISPAFAYGTNNVFANLPAGAYTVRVRDAIGCELEFSNVIITEPAAALTATVATTDEICINESNGTVTVTINGGTAPYATSLNGVTFNNGQLTYTGLADGSYTMYVTDANNCAITPINFTIAPGVDVQATVDVTDNCTANVVGNVVTVNVNAAVATDVQYSVDGVIYQASNTFNNLAPGNYTAYVQHTNGCTQTVGFTIDNLVPVTANATVTSNVLCFGEASGVITVNATGGTGTIEYAISPAFAYGTNNVFANLPAGAYTVRVRDAIGCELEFSNVIITEPAAALTATVATTDEICINESNGTVTVTINGGTAPYATSLNGVTFNNGQLTYTGLADGSYTMYVTDANNCAITPINFTIAPGVDVQATVDVTDNCTANVVGNVVTVNVNAAVAADVQYSVDGVTYQASNTFTNLAPGAYTAYVQHANGCIATATFDIDNLVPVTANATVTSNVLCFGEASGVITVNATGGTGTIEYAISPAFAYGTNNLFANLPAGAYTVRVRDAIGCELEFSNVIITEPAAALTATVATTDELCINESNGTVNVTINGGTAPYATSLNGVTFNNGQLTYTGLADGNYTMYVTDANNCAITPINFTIAPGINLQAMLDIDTTCNNNTPGNVVTVSVTAALAPNVQYSLDGVTYGTINTWTDLAPGTYTAYVQHTNGCIDSETFTIDSHDPVQASAVVTSNTSCFGVNVGQIVVNATGGTGTLNYAISPNFNYTTSNIFNNLAAGTYTIRVKDYIGCEVEITGVVVTGPTAALTATVTGTHETCLGANDGSITVSISGGTAPYSTALNTSNPSFFQPGVLTYNNLTGGDLHLVYVRDANGCQIGPLFFDVEDGVDLKPSVDVELNCIDNTPGNIVTFTIDEELEPETQYSLDGVTYQDSNIFTDVPQGTYQAYVLHENGCLVNVWFTIDGRTPIAANATSTDATCNAATNGTVTVTATGGTGDLTYGISPDFNMSSATTFTNLPAGNYTVRVQDETGCYSDVIDVIVGEPAAIVVDVVDVMQEICIGEGNAAIEITVSGGAGAPYYTSLTPTGNFVEGQFLFDNLVGGQTVTVYVRDANNCMTEHQVILDAPINIDATAQVEYNCESNVVTVFVDESAGTSLMYSLNGGAPQTSNVFTNLPNGNHVVTVVHAEGCSDQTLPFNVTNSLQLGLTASVTGFNEITALASGGNGSYTYSFNDVDYGNENVYVYDRSGACIVTVTDERGCTAQTILNVTFTEITIPDVSTPNNDGQNDTWGPGNAHNYPNIATEIFDRYGRLIETLRAGETWDGTYNGTELPTGDYWYIIRLNDPEGKEFVGHFTIYR